MKDRDVVLMRIEGEREVLFGYVLVRVSPDYRPVMHIDTDEANAAGIANGVMGTLVAGQDRR